MNELTNSSRIAAPLAQLLLPAYSPCPAFSGTCRSMRWSPSEGHVPRGMCGATGDVRDVRLVLVVAEPGDPQPGESHPANPSAALDSTTAYAYDSFRNGKDLFHRNVRYILDLCFPGMSFEAQMRLTWITESVLCSAGKEGGNVPKSITTECRSRYLEPQLRSLPNVVVVALGSKAAKRLGGLPGVIEAAAAAPPGCNFADAKPSWHRAADAVRARHDQLASTTTKNPSQGKSISAP